MKKLFVIAAVLAVLMPIVFTHSAKAAAPTREVNFQFANGTKSARPLQDVFVERNDIALDQVARLELKDLKDESNMTKMMYASTVATTPDPQKLGSNPLGPFPKGPVLGFTVEQWNAATGTGTYTVDRDVAELKLSFQRLAPNGLYTMWCGPSGKFACGAPDGSQNAFRADAQRNGALTIKNMKPLADTTKDAPSVLALAYHSDNQTWGASPGEFGRNSHVQLLFVLPAPAPAPATLPTTGGEDDATPHVWHALLAGAALIVGGLFMRRRGKRA